ncbi:PREDICTED: extensin-like [Calidris pugnax]|uniref:extensin-like n=1 Tax=Calidris pugnax TaxID=198806 RepID=UPI00071C312C|nr:PREDICTED: extensin-like [Calidris pugnax]
MPPSSPMAGKPAAARKAGLCSSPSTPQGPRQSRPPAPGSGRPAGAGPQRRPRRGPGRGTGRGVGGVRPSAVCRHLHKMAATFGRDTSPSRRTTTTSALTRPRTSTPILNYPPGPPGAAAALLSLRPSPGMRRPTRRDPEHKPPHLKWRPARLTRLGPPTFSPTQPRCPPHPPRGQAAGGGAGPAPPRFASGPRPAVVQRTAPSPPTPALRFAAAFRSPPTPRRAPLPPSIEPRGLLSAPGTAHLRSHPPATAQ